MKTTRLAISMMITLIVMGCGKPMPLSPGQESSSPVPPGGCHPDSSLVVYRTSPATISVDSPLATLVNDISFDRPDNRLVVLLNLEYDASSNEDMTCFLQDAYDARVVYYLRTISGSTVIRQPSNFTGDTTMVVSITDVPVGHYRLTVHYEGTIRAPAAAIKPTAIMHTAWHPTIAPSDAILTSYFCR